MPVFRLGEERFDPGLSLAHGLRVVLGRVVVAHAVEVRLVEAAVLADPGAIVVADRLTPAITAQAAGWLLFYPAPDYENVAILGGQEGGESERISERIDEPAFADIVAAIDRLGSRPQRLGSTPISLLPPVMPLTSSLGEQFVVEPMGTPATPVMSLAEAFGQDTGPATPMATPAP